jgi:hypothetical protein
MIALMRSSKRKAEPALLDAQCDKINDSARRTFRSGAQYRRLA